MFVFSETVKSFFFASPNIILPSSLEDLIEQTEPSFELAKKEGNLPKLTWSILAYQLTHTNLQAALREKTEKDLPGFLAEKYNEIFHKLYSVTFRKKTAKKISKTTLKNSPEYQALLFYHIECQTLTTIDINPNKKFHQLELASQYFSIFFPGNKKDYSINKDTLRKVYENSTRKNSHLALACIIQTKIDYLNSFKGIAGTLKKPLNPGAWDVEKQLLLLKYLTHLSSHEKLSESTLDQIENPDTKRSYIPTRNVTSKILKQIRQHFNLTREQGEIKNKIPATLRKHIEELVNNYKLGDTCNVEQYLQSYVRYCLTNNKFLPETIKELVIDILSAKYSAHLERRKLNKDEQRKIFEHYISPGSLQQIGKSFTLFQHVESQLILHPSIYLEDFEEKDQLLSNKNLEKINQSQYNLEISEKISRKITGLPYSIIRHIDKQAGIEDTLILYRQNEKRDSAFLFREKNIKKKSPEIAQEPGGIIATGGFGAVRIIQRINQKTGQNRFEARKVIKIKKDNDEDYKRKLKLTKKEYKSTKIRWPSASFWQRETKDFTIFEIYMPLFHGKDLYFWANEGLSAAKHTKVIYIQFEIIRQCLIQLRDCYHSKNYVHADIKSENIILNFDENARPLVTIIDEGCTRPIAAYSSSYFTGTYDYYSWSMSEDYMREANISYHIGTDLYALGCTFKNINQWTINDESPIHADSAQYFKTSTPEYLLSHFLDKLMSNAVGKNFTHPLTQFTLKQLNEFIDECTALCQQAKHKAAPSPSHSNLLWKHH